MREAINFEYELIVRLPETKTVTFLMKVLHTCFENTILSTVSEESLEKVRKLQFFNF